MTDAARAMILAWVQSWDRKGSGNVLLDDDLPPILDLIRRVDEHTAEQTAALRAALNHLLRVKHSDAMGSAVLPPVEWCDDCRALLAAHEGQG